MGALAIRTRRVVADLEWMRLGIDADRNQAGAVEIRSPAATVRTFILPIDEEKWLGLIEQLFPKDKWIGSRMSVLGKAHES